MNHHSFETDVMDDLSFDAAEGPAHARQAYDAYEEDYGDEFDAYDEEDSADDEFIGGLIRGIGQLVGGGSSADEYDEYEEGFDEGDELEAMDAYDEYETHDDYDEYDEGDYLESLEEAVADAMDAADTDEFLRRLRRVASGAVRVARRVAPVVGRIARTVAPIASAIPLPQAQAIGRIASVAGRLLADGADEYEAIDAMIDMAEDHDAVDAAAPLIAGLALRTVAPRVARAALPVRRQAVHALSRSVQTLAQRQGAPAARAAVRVARAVGRRPIPARAIAPAVRRVTPQIGRRPAQVRRFSRPLAPGAGGAMRRPVAGGLRRPRPAGPGVMRRPVPGRRPGALPPRQRPMGAAAAPCPNCGRTRSFRLRGPVTLTVRSNS